jgi:mannose-6-phosphate isomerase-like protein (cupin superfamily)
MDVLAPRGRRRVEFATVWGREVALPAHFHDEHQFTLVLSGRRTFLIGDRPVVVF